MFVNSEALPKLAWFEYLPATRSDPSHFSTRRQTAERGGPSVEPLLSRDDLNRLGRYEQARTNLDAALAEREDLILARQEKGESLWLLGRKEEAITVWTEAVQRNERLALVSNQLAGAKRSLGRIEEAIAHEKLADQSAPDDPLFIGCLASG